VSNFSFARGGDVLLLYVEFFNRLPGVSLQEFHRVAGAVEAWSEANTDDRLVLNIGRTWRIGPEPEYLCVWYSERHGLDRIDDWERVFVAAGEAAGGNGDFFSVARIERAGCYTVPMVPRTGRSGRYYLEWLEIEPGVTDGEVASWFERRAGEHTTLELDVVARPLGPLAPRSLGFAVWGLPTYGDAQPVALEPIDPAAPVRVVDASLYADVGHEQH
jgi:hypothetical protein